MIDLNDRKRRVAAFVAAGSLALAGGFAGGCGSDDDDEAVQDAQDAVENAGNEAEDVAEDVGDAAEDAANEAGEAAEDVGDAAEDAAEEIDGDDN